MKKHFLAFLLCLSLLNNSVFASDSAPKVEPAPVEQRFCGVRPIQDAPPKKEAGSIESLFEVDFFQSHFEKNCLLVFGLKGWGNTWSLPISLPGLGKAYTQDTAVLFKSATEFTAMPTLTFRYKNFYLSVNRFFKTDYTFGTQKIDSLFAGRFGEDKITTQYKDSEGNTYIYETRAGEDSQVAIKVPLVVTPVADRSEWDLTLGYYLNEYLALMVGYKKIQRNYKYSVEFPVISLHQEKRDIDGKVTYEETFDWGTEFVDDINSESTGSGMTVGILGAVPVRGKLSLYGNLTYGWLDTDIDSNSTGGLPEFIASTIVPESSREYDTPYYSGEVGFAYRLADFQEVGFSFYLGYRFQRYEFEDATSSGQTTRDGTDGFIASFSASF